MPQVPFLVGPTVIVRFRREHFPIVSLVEVEMLSLSEKVDRCPSGESGNLVRFEGPPTSRYPA